MKLRLIHKGILLVSIPLCFEIGLFSVLLSLQNQVDAEAQRVDRARKINDEINKVIRDVVEIGTVSRNLAPGFQLSQLRGQFNEIYASLTELDDLTKDDAVLNAPVKSTARSFENAIRELRTAPQRMRESGDIPQVIKATRRRVDADLQNVLYSGMLEVANESLKGIDETRSIEIRREFVTYLRLALLLSVLVALVAAALYTYDLARRLRTVKQNAERLANDKDLLPRVSGSDEIAELDGALHFARRWMLASEKKERAILTYASDIIISLDKRLYITSSNPRGDSLLARPGESLLQDGFLKFIVESDRERVRQELGTVQETANAGQIETTIVCIDSSTKEVSISVSFSPVENSYYCVIHDVTEKKQIEKLRQEVTAMITHDLRTPLQSVKAFMEMLEYGRLGQLNEQGAKLLKLTQRESGRMTKLIESVLQLEKLRSKAIELEKTSVSVQVLIKLSCEAVSLLAGEKNIELVSRAVPDRLTLTGDQAWLEQVIVNLLSNAIKFSPQDSKIDITGQIDKTGQFAEIAIKDQGPGIDENERSLLFERFHRASTTNDVEGSGLGLAICKELVELHDGYIRIDSAPKEGSTFTVGIPLAPEGTNQ